MTVDRFVVESTTYYDWFYGLRHLFHRGARPRAVVLVLNARQWLTTAVRGEVTAGLMFDRRDILRIATDAGLDRTHAGGLIFASFSRYYANRMDVRKWLLGLVIPGLDELSSRLAPPTPPLPPDDQIEHRLRPRIRAIKDLCAAHGTRLVLILPPTHAARSGAEAVEAAGLRVGVDVRLPIDEHRFGLENYAEGFHLNARGRARFTAALAPVLTDILQPSAAPR
jgi:hypothetical protein